MQTQIRRRRTRRLIRVSTVCKWCSHFSLGICKSHHSRVYLKLKLVSSNIKCGRVYSVYNGLKQILTTDRENMSSGICWQWRPRSACAFAPSDQVDCCPLQVTEAFDTIKCFNGEQMPGRDCARAGWCDSDLFFSWRGQYNADLNGYTLFFLFLLKNIDCWYSLEPPRRGGSNEYPQSMLWVEIRKNIRIFI